MSMLCLWAPLATFVFTSITTSGGVGGAFILVPIFYWLGLPMYAAETLGLLMALFSAGSSCISYHMGRNIEYKMALALIVSTPIFSPLGSYASAVMNKSIVLLVFSLLLAIGGSIMLFYHPKRIWKGDDTGNSRRNYICGLLAGGLIGFFSGLLGIGGGMLVGPFLLMQGFPAKTVSGTSSLFVVFSALIGFIGHLDFMAYAHVHINYLLFVLVVVAALAGGAFGSHLARFKLSAMQIRRIIGTLQYVMAAKMILGL